MAGIICTREQASSSREVGKEKLPTGDDLISSTRESSGDNRISSSSTTLVEVGTENVHNDSGAKVTAYTKNDVLSGRGSTVNSHSGNRFYRKCINAQRRTYLNSKWTERRAIAKSIVDAMRARGGRFLKQGRTASSKGPGHIDADHDVWYEIGDKGAIDKTTQALRQMKMRRKLLVEDEKTEYKNKREEEHDDNLSSSLGAGLYPQRPLEQQGKAVDDPRLPIMMSTDHAFHRHPVTFPLEHDLSMTGYRNLWLSRQHQNTYNLNLQAATRRQSNIPGGLNLFKGSIDMALGSYLPNFYDDMTRNDKMGMMDSRIASQSAPSWNQGGYKRIDTNYLAKLLPPLSSAQMLYTPSFQPCSIEPPRPPYS